MRFLLYDFFSSLLHALFQILKDEEVNTYLPWFPTKNLEETKRFFEEKFVTQYKLPQAYAYAICLKTDDIPIGYMAVGMDNTHDFVYGLRKEFWHKGITSEAALAVIEQIKQAGFPYITATHDRKNVRSGSVMQRIGMHYKYSYEEQWQPKNIPVIFRMYQLNFKTDVNYVYMKYWNMYKNGFVEEIQE